MSDPVTVKVMGRENLVRNISSYGEDVSRRIVVVMEVVQAKISNFAKNNHPYRDRTGNLTKSIMPGRVLIEDRFVTMEVRAGDKFAPYASFVENGTSRARPYPFLYPALMKHRSELVQRARVAISGARP